MGIPFVNMGRAQEGADCWGLVVLVYRDQYRVRVPLYAEEAYKTEKLEAISDLIEKNKRFYFSEIDEPGEGDIILLRYGEYSAHMGIFVGEECGHPYILHTTRARGQSYCERLTSKVFEHATPSYHRIIH